MDGINHEELALAVEMSREAYHAVQSLDPGDVTVGDCISAIEKLADAVLHLVEGVGS